MNVKIASKTLSRLISSKTSVRSNCLRGFHSGGCVCCGLTSFMCKNQSNSSSSFINNQSFTTFSSLSNDNVADADCHMKNIMENNKRWVSEMNAEDPEFFTKLAKPQNPKYLYFGCSDSRVPANEILGLGAGEVFVHRNIGNLVPGNDLNALSVLEYAVGHLNVTDIIVAGHYGCGAIKAASSRQDLGMLENWLRQIRDVYRLHKDYLDLIHNDDQRQNTLVELNVIEQCLNIYKTGIVQRKRIQTKNELMKGVTTGHSFDENDVYPRIHGMVFNVADGVLNKIPVDFKRRVGSLDHIYGLYTRANPVTN